MATATQIAAQKLAADAESVFKDPRLSSAQKARKLDDLQFKLSQLTAEKSLGFDPRLLANGVGADPGLSSGPSNGFGAKIGNAPPLRLDDASTKALFDAAQSRQSLGVKASVNLVNDDPATYPWQLLPPVSFKREPTRIADVIPSTAVDRGTVEYYQTTGTAAAAPTTEATLKPQSSITYARKQAVAVKIAHWLSASEEAINDFPTFTQLVQSDMIAGVILAENNQLLNGSGVAPNMFGMLNTSGILTRAQTAGTPPTPSDLDVIELAIADLRAGSRYAEPDAMIMAPGTFTRLRLVKDTQGRYISGPPNEVESNSLWGIPVVITSQAPANMVLLGAFKESVVLFVRSGIEVRTSSGGDSFRSNLLDIVCEERLALAVVAPAGLIKATLV